MGWHPGREVVLSLFAGGLDRSVTSFINIHGEATVSSCLYTCTLGLIFQGGEDGAAGEDGGGPPTGCPFSEEEGAEAGILVLPGGAPQAAM